MYFGSLTFKNKLFGNPDVLAYLLVYCCAKQVNVAWWYQDIIVAVLRWKQVEGCILHVKALGQ